MSQQNSYRCIENHRKGNPMSTYEVEKVITEYANDRMPVEMAMGHSLQHIGKLYAAQTICTTTQRALNEQVNQLTTAVKTLHSAVHHQPKAPAGEWQQKFEEHLTVLNTMVANLRADVDRLITHTRLPPNPKSKRPSSGTR
jgi:hypothetical protein